MAAEILVDPGVSETGLLDSVMTPAVSVDSDITLVRTASAVSVNLGVSGTGMTAPGMTAENSVNSGVSGTDKTGLMKTRAGLTRKK